MLVPLATLPIVALAALFAVPRLRGIAYALGTLALLPPMSPGALPLVRFVLAIVACGGLARVVELAREDETPARRVLRALTIVDWRTSARVAPRTDPLRALAALAYAAIAALSVLALLRTRPGVLWPGWALGAIAVWAFAETINATLAFALGIAGVRIAPLHDRPLASRSLAELWGRRWNLTVSRWLRRCVFAPLAPRHATLGVLAAFVASALFHAYVAGAAGGPIVAAVMAAYFVVQGVLMLVERALHLRGSRAWFFIAVLVPSPLFVEPMIAIAVPSASPLGSMPFG